MRKASAILLSTSLVIAASSAYIVPPTVALADASWAARAADTPDWHSQPGYIKIRWNNLHKGIVKDGNGIDVSISIPYNTNIPEAG